MNTTLTRGDLQQLTSMLTDLRDVRFDVVADARALAMDAGDLILPGMDARLTLDGVETIDARLTPNGHCDGQLADKLGIPRRYLSRLRTEAVDLLDENVNHWLQADARRFFVRGFKRDDGSAGMARAVLSDGYRALDHLDTLFAGLAGIQKAGIDAKVRSCSLSDTAMHVRLVAPELAVAAPGLLHGYRSPFTGDTGAENPMICAGLRIDNSEVGAGALQIAPFVEVQVCKNGMTKTADALRQIHAGTKMASTGIVDWSDDTHRLNSELVTSMVSDAVRTFLSPEYLASVVAEMEAASGVRLADPVATIERVAKVHTFTADEQASILSHFIEGGDCTAGGVMQAVTSVAQTLNDPDRVGSFEDAALGVLQTAAFG